MILSLLAEKVAEKLGGKKGVLKREENLKGRWYKSISYIASLSIEMREAPCSVYIKCVIPGSCCLHPLYREITIVRSKC